MGFRKPTATGVFFAQAKAGAEEQKKAREKLQKPQALGGSAAVGTQMVAAQTQAQQGATQQVKATTQQAGKDLAVNPADIGTSMTAAVTGAPTISAAPPEVKVASGQASTVEQVDTSGKAINDAIDQTTNLVNELNTRLQTAEGEDRKRLLDERNRLDALLKSYQEKRSKENLGEIAGPSEFEQQMTERERLLAEQGQNVAKLASIFGPGWNARRYGGLASQIYGKDLEAIQETAGAGLQAKQRAESEADAGINQYEEQLKTGQKSYTEALDTESKKLDLLKATPNELAGYNKDELIKLFGKDAKGNDIANSLFTFSPDGKVIQTKASETRKALQDRLTQLGAEKEKIGEERTKAQNRETAEYDEIVKKVGGKDTYGILNSKGLEEDITRIMGNMQAMDDTASWRREAGFTKKYQALEAAVARSQDKLAKIRKLQNESETIQKNEKLSKAEKIAKLKEIDVKARNIKAGKG